MRTRVIVSRYPLSFLVRSESFVLYLSLLKIAALPAIPAKSVLPKLSISWVGAPCAHRSLLRGSRRRALNESEDGTSPPKARFEAPPTLVSRRQA
jgi:hypothetical protein